MIERKGGTRDSGQIGGTADLDAAGAREAGKRQGWRASPGTRGQSQLIPFRGNCPRRGRGADNGFLSNSNFFRGPESRVPSPESRQKGFTLVEVLVALVIFGVIAASVLKTLQDSVRQQAALEERLAANWVAQQVLEEIRLQNPWPPLGQKTERITLGGREWQVSASVQATSEARMRHIAIEVGRPDASPMLSIDSWAAQE